MPRATAELHFHTNQNQLMNIVRMRMRLATSENKKSLLQDQVRKLETQLTKLRTDKDAEIFELQLEKTRLKRCNCSYGAIS